MSIFSKLAFWKKDDDYDFDSPGNDSFAGSPMNSTGADPFSSNGQSQGFPDSQATQSTDPFASSNNSFGATDNSFGSDSLTGPRDPLLDSPIPGGDSMNSMGQPSIANHDSFSNDSSFQNSHSNSTFNQPVSQTRQMARNMINSSQQQKQEVHNQESTTNEILNLKLDAIKSQLEVITQRLDKLDSTFKTRRQW